MWTDFNNSFTYGFVDKLQNTYRNLHRHRAVLPAIARRSCLNSCDQSVDRITIEGPVRILNGPAYSRPTFSVAPLQSFHSRPTNEGGAENAALHGNRGTGKPETK